MSDLDAPWELLARHLAAELDAADQAALRAWLREDARHLQVLTTVTRAWERAGEVAPAPALFSAQDVEAAWQRFRPHMAALHAVPPSSGLAPVSVPAAVPQSGWAGRAPAWRIAAGIALLCGGAFALSRSPFFNPGPAPEARYASGPQRRELHLPDGSTVWLNANSRLHYTATAHQSRQVQLTGEAYFDVRPAAGQPFVVSTTTARVRVVGTAFNVRAYAAEDSVEVSVTHGRVWLARLAAPDSVLLTAGTRAALRATDAPGSTAAALRRAPAPDANFRAWQTDTLRFRDATVAHVARTLRAAFGTRIEVASPGLARCRFTGTFAHPQPAQVLEVLALATGSRAETAATGGYVLRGPGCGATADSATFRP